MSKSKGRRPDKVSRESASFLGTGIGEVHKTTIHQGGTTYSGKGTSKEQADKQAGDRYRTGHKDRRGEAGERKGFFRSPGRENRIRWPGW